MEYLSQLIFYWAVLKGKIDIPEVHKSFKKNPKPGVQSAPVNYTLYIFRILYGILIVITG